MPETSQINVTRTQALAAPTRFKIHGKSYLLKPLQYADYALFEQWLQDAHMAVAKRNLAGLESDERQALLSHAFDKAAQITIDSPPAKDAMKTVQGAVKLAWLSLRHEQPDLTEEAVGDMLTDAETLAELMEQLPMGTSSVEAELLKKKPLKRAPVTRKDSRRNRKVKRVRRRTKGRSSGR